MKTHFNLIQSLLLGGGGGLASVFFALLAVSVSENAAAQAVQVCAAGDSVGMNPHDSSTNPGEKNTCRNSAGGGIYTVPSPTSGFSCATCIEFSALVSAPAFFNQLCDIVYRIEGDSVDYCGSRSQCDAVGGILLSVTLGSGSSPATPTGEVCQCDAGNARIGGICVDGETEADCEDFEEYASTEDADRTEGACRPRVAGDCTDPNDEFVAASGGTGGTCECNQGYSRDNDGACVLGQVCINDDFGSAGTNPHDPNQIQSGSCASDDDGVVTTDPNSNACGFCRNDRCAVDNGVIYSVEGVSWEFCGTSSQCEAVSGVVENGNCSGECNEGFERGALGLNNGRCLPACRSDERRNPNGICECRDSSRVNFNGACLTECPIYAIPTRLGTSFASCEECPVNEIRGSDGTCGACPIENEVRALEETMCSCPDSTHFDNPAGTCDERIDSTCTGIQRYDSGTNTCIDCADNQIQSDSDAESCVDCPIENHVREGNAAMCSCPDATHYGDDTENTCVERLTCPGNQRYNRSDNTCIDCAENEVQSDSDPGSCVACQPTQVRTGSETECSACPGFANVAAGTCDAIAECTAAQSRLVNNVCTECDTDQHLVNGSCEACPENHVRAQEAAECRCRQDYYTGGGSCTAFLECMNNLTLNREDNTCFCNSATDFEEADGTCVPHTDCTREGANVIRNTETNACVCADDFEGTPETSCTACVGEYVSENGANCACPRDESFDAGEGMCEMSLEGTCTEPRTNYNMATNECECPQGQRLTADESACEAIPASSDGGSSNGAVIALVAVPAVLIGGYWLLGGFDYIDPAYNLDYSGENGDLDWRGNAGFNLRHGGLHSYASAIQSNGNAVSYESGISYERRHFSLTYAATESQSDYDFDLGAGLEYNLGVMTISPTAAAELQYRTDEEDWDAETSMGVSADWTAHRWIVRGRSDFAGDGGHSLDVELRF